VARQAEGNVPFCHHILDNSTRDVSDELLEALTMAYKEAAGGEIEI
jgi:hypothetical protein